MVRLARAMFNLEEPREGSLFKPEKSRVGDFVEGSVSKDLDQRLVVGDHGQLVAALREVA